MTNSSITAAVFDAVDDWSQPLLTHYDHTSGERTELSGTTVGNWAAKTANFVVDELGAGDGDAVVVDLPEHWQTVAVLLGLWWAGTQVRMAAAGTGHAAAAAVVTSADRIDHYDDVDDVLVASLDPFAMGVGDLPPGVTDFATAVRMHGDHYTPGAVGPGPVLDEATTADVLDASARCARDDGITAGARVVTTRPWRTAAEITANLVAPLVTGASLITVAHADPGRLDQLVDTERADVVLR